MKPGRIVGLGMPGKDMKKELKELYSGRLGRFDEVKVPALRYLAIEGKGDPAKAFGPAMHAIYSIAYPLKFMIKARDPKLEYVVMPPEALFPAQPSVYSGPRERWPWTILILQPVAPTQKELALARARALEKGAPSIVKDVKLLRVPAHRAVQTLHVGPYDASHVTIEKLHAFLAEHDLTFAGPHHEVYLSDPGRAGPSKAKTIFRQPVKAAPAARRASRVRVAAV